MSPPKTRHLPSRAPGARSQHACGDSDLRCGCGSLLARLVADAIELKCRRCKQTWRIPLEE